MLSKRVERSKCIEKYFAIANTCVFRCISHKFVSKLLQYTTAQLQALWFSYISRFCLIMRSNTSTPKAMRHVEVVGSGLYLTPWKYLTWAEI